MANARVRFELEGRLQGVGFRPFVWRLADRLGLKGFVCNSDRGVWIEVEGSESQIKDFQDQLTATHPTTACIESISCVQLPVEFPSGNALDAKAPRFHIEASMGESSTSLSIVPDHAPCADCLREMSDPGDRRYLFPMISCTTCGPRYSIHRGIPFDRARTTLDRFPMCSDCSREYSDPLSRRFHAQSIGCFACGPQWTWSERGQTEELLSRADLVDTWLQRAASLLRSGGVLLIKGVGGYQFVCNARDDQAVLRVRSIKHRNGKPFAVLVRSVDTAEEWVQLTEMGRGILCSMERPIVVGKTINISSGGEPLSPLVSPMRCSLGVLLPNTPMHELLMRAIDFPLVVTSANDSGEPMLIDDNEALIRYRGIVDAVLRHDREIVHPLDDSVWCDAEPHPIPVRRGRGIVPLVFPSQGEDGLAFGGDLKVSLAARFRHKVTCLETLGDANHPETSDRIWKIAETWRMPEKEKSSNDRFEVIHVDLHPEYRSREIGLRFAMREHLRIREVQHHAAHLGGLALENRMPADVPFAGFVFDGTGYGSDATFWGGELLAIKGANVERLGCLRPILLPSGDVCPRHPWRTALAMILDSYFPNGGPLLETLELFWKSPFSELSRVEKRFLIDPVGQSHGVASSGIPSSSMGRLIDAVASLLNVVHTNEYEGHAAMLLEDLAWQGQMMDKACESITGFGISRVESCLYLDSRPVIRSIVDACLGGQSREVIAYGFHLAIAKLVIKAIEWLPDELREMKQIGLTGGVFQNRLLVEEIQRRASRIGYRVLVHRHIPPNDSGLSLGQLWFSQTGAEL